jgi:hypothetical protein
MQFLLMLAEVILSRLQRISSGLSTYGFVNNSYHIHRNSFSYHVEHYPVTYWRRQGQTLQKTQIKTNKMGPYYCGGAAGI